MASRIEDYALIGDCETAALVGRDGSIDWLCLPRFDSGACFAALLGDARHGRWQIGPVEPVSRVTRRYRDDTLVLETTYATAGGTVMLIDFMPPYDGHSNLVRIVAGVSGRVPMQTELVVRFDYGAAVPWVRPCPGSPGLRRRFHRGGAGSGASPSPRRVSCAGRCWRCSGSRRGSGAP